MSATDYSPGLTVRIARPLKLNPVSHRQLPLLVGPALDRGCLAVSRDHAHALVDPGSYVIRRAALQERDAVVAARRKDAVARGLHFRRVRLAWNDGVAERKTQIARADLGKTQSRHCQYCFAIG